jgi:hypothetical protein
MLTQEEVAHSAEVQMHLVLNGCTLAVSQMGPDYLRLREPAEAPPCDAQIVLVIDGHESRWLVHLPEGIRPEHGRIPVEKIP